MSIARWEPFSEMLSLRDAMNRLFEESFVHPRSFIERGMFIPVDVLETENEYICRIALPGVHPEDCDITIQQNTLRLFGEFHGPEVTHGPDGQTGTQQMAATARGAGQHASQQRIAGQEQERGQQYPWNYLIQEIPRGRFTRSITFSTPVDADRANAEFDAGVLVITLPKAESARPRRLQVRGETGRQQAELRPGGGTR